MKYKWIWILVCVFIVFLWFHKRNQKSIDTENASVLTIEEPVQTKVPTAKTTAREWPVPPPPQNQLNTFPTPKARNGIRKTDVFGARSLDHPKPRSISELRSKLTDYQGPKLPAPSDDMYDGDVWTGYRGFYLSTSGKFRRLQVNRDEVSVSLSLEDDEGQYHEWSQQKNELELKNFDNDPYSLVIITPDERTLYLKFYSALQIPGLNKLKRAMTGWILSGAPTKVSPAALIDFQFDGAQGPGGGQWPPLDSIKKIMPGSLQ